MDKKKLSAAMAAVFTTIKTTEEAVCVPVAEEPVQAPAAQQPVPVQYNIWGISGRQTHMQANSMMQLRLFK